MADVFLSWAKGTQVEIQTSQSGPTAVQLQTIVVDATIEEVHNLESEVTSAPVEEGPDVSDHIRPKPRTYVISDGLISETPVPPPGTAPGTPPDTTLPAQAYATLVEIWQNQAVLSIATGIELYENMVMTSCPVKRSAKNGNSLRFSATFQEIQIVSSQTVDLPRTLPKTKRTANLGKVTGTPPAKDQSVLNSVFTPNGGNVSAGLIVQ